MFRFGGNVWRFSIGSGLGTSFGLAVCSVPRWSLPHRYIVNGDKLRYVTSIIDPKCDPVPRRDRPQVGRSESKQPEYFLWLSGCVMLFGSARGWR